MRLSSNTANQENPFYSRYCPLNWKEILRKLPRAISQESANVSMNETLISFLQRNRTENVKGKRGKGKKISSATVVDEEIPQEEKKPDSSQKCNILAESSNDESSDEEEDDGTTYKIFNIPRIELKEKCGYQAQCDICDEYIVPKCFQKRYINHAMTLAIFIESTLVSIS